MRFRLQPLRLGWPALAGIAGTAAAVVLLALWGVAEFSSRGPAAGERAPAPAPGGDETAAAADPSTAAGGNGIEANLKQAIHLYFVAPDGRHLVAETRTVMRPADPVAFGRQIVTALLEGPRTPAGRSLPEGSRLRAFYLGEDGVAYVDLDETVSRQHPGGVTLERLSVYSLVNSLVLNSDDIKKVRLLIEGREATTLAGHIDLQRAFNANMLMIK